MIFVAWHLGLGDAIACAAIVAKIAKDEWVTVPCWSHNEVSVKSMFINYPRVNVMVIEKDSLLKPESILPNYYKQVLRLGYYNTELPQLPDEDFVQWFYRQAGMDISEKEKYCPIKKASYKYVFNEPGHTNIDFIHDDKERGFVINNIRDRHHVIPIRPENNGRTILEYSDFLTKASHVHCIDSSFLHLAEALNVTGKKFYHKYARPNSTDFKYLKGWEVIQ